MKTPWAMAPIYDFENIVFTEAITFILVLMTLISAYKHWGFIFISAICVSCLSLCTIWSFAIAFGALSVYVPISILFWLEIDIRTSYSTLVSIQYVRRLCWLMILIGMGMLIARNIFNIYQYMS